MEHHHFQCENLLFQWPFSIAMLVHQRVIHQYFTNMSPIIGITECHPGCWVRFPSAVFTRSRSAELSPSSSSSSCLTPGVTCLRSLELWSSLEGFPAIWVCTFQTQSSMLLHHWFELEVPQSWWLHPHMIVLFSVRKKMKKERQSQYRNQPNVSGIAHLPNQLQYPLLIHANSC